MSLVALVVDDSMLIRCTVGRLLEERGYKVESAANGLEALEILKRERADLIVTDMQMPKMSGGEFIAALKSAPQTAQIPVIVLSGTESDMEAEKRANFAICKDIDVEAQLGKALDILNSNRAGGSAISQAQVTGK